MSTRHDTLTMILVAVTALAGAGADAIGQCELLRIGGMTSQNLATSLDADPSGTVVAIGAPSFPGVDGAVVVYRNGAFEQELLPETSPFPQAFGQSVAAGADRIVGAAPFYRADFSDFVFGAVWTFTFDGVTWNREPVLRGTGAAFGDQFGSIVAMDGDRLLVDFVPNGGARRVDVHGRQGGAWTKNSELTSPESGADASFGTAFAVQGDEAFVAAPVASIQLEGAVFVYELDDGIWFHVDTLRAPVPAADDAFGRAIAVDGDALLIGAPGSDFDHGAVHVYRRIAGTWTFEATITNAAISPGVARFGDAVDVVGDVALIGASSEGGQVLQGGTASIFVHDAGTWTRLVKYVASDTEVFGDLGAAVAIAEDAYVGAPEANGATGNEGAAYVYAIEPPASDCDNDAIDDDCALLIGLVDDCNRNGVADPCDILNATSEDVNGNGIPDECEDCNRNGTPDLDDIASGFSMDCNANGLPDECEIDDGTPGGPFFCPFDCDPDCNVNGVPDACDVADGTSNDVNGDGVPDECQPDCNGNGVPDDADLAAGTSEDRNGDSVPDECQTFGTCTQGDIVASDGTPGAGFGIALDASGDRVIVGASRDGERGADAGAAYVYVVQPDGTWRQETKLAPGDIGPGDFYGFAVAIDGDVAVVGSLGLDAVDVYRFDGVTWSREQRIDVMPGAGFERFGHAVDVCDDRLIASDPADGPNGTSAFTGSVCVYAYDAKAGTWNPETMLVPPIDVVSAQFGIDVALDGPLAVIGAFADSSTGDTAAGSAHVYRRDGTTWSFEASLRAAGASAFDGYGGRVDVDASCERAIVGAFGDSGSNVVEASVFVNTKRGWQEEAALPLGDPPSSNGFAHDVAIAGDRAYVGDGQSDISGDAGGATFVFVWADPSWTLADVLLPPTSEAGGQRGAALAIGEDRVLLGAPGQDAGRVVDVRLAGTDCNRNGTCDDVDIANGTSDDADGDGRPDECPLADLNDDGSVGFADLTILLNAWGPCGDADCRADLDGSGSVGFADLVILLQTWGETIGDP